MTQTQSTQPPTGAHPTLTEAHVIERLRQRPDRMLDVGHAKLSHWSFGQGPDVVCVHGWPLHAATFRKIVPLLADRFTVHLLDLPGTGQSEWDDRSKISLVSHAESIRRCVDLLGLRRFAYLGHDSGAAITRLAAAGDERVFASVMGNTEVTRHVPWQIKAFVAAAKVPPVWRAFLGMMRSETVLRSPLGFGGCFTDSGYVLGEFGDWFVRPLFESPRVAAGQTRLVMGLEGHVVARMADTHAAQRAPSLLIWGPDDPFFPVARARAMLPEFGAPAGLVEIPRGKLFVHEDRAAEFADATRRFLLEHAPR